MPAPVPHATAEAERAEACAMLNDDPDRCQLEKDLDRARSELKAGDLSPDMVADSLRKTLDMRWPGAASTRGVPQTSAAIEAERGVLGSILLDAPRVLRLCEAAEITPDSFNVAPHPDVFRALSGLHKAGVAVDLVTAVDRLRTAGRLEEIGGVPALEALVDATPTAAHAEHYIGMLRAADDRRRLEEWHRKAGEAIARGDSEPALTADKLAAELARTQALIAGTLTDKARALADIPSATDGDANELLRHRYLCICGALLLVGPAGVGKSALLLQLLLTWAAGRATFGIAPARPLRSVLVQSEDDDGDLAEMRDGILAGLVESGELTRDEAEAAARAVFVLSAPDAQGDRLPPLLRRMIGEHKPDLLALNPAFGFVSGDTNKAQDVGAFLRGALHPIIKTAGIGLILVHHSNKPPSGRERTELRAGENAYLGAGSAEWANYCRAVLAVKSLGSSSVFQLVAGKRGSRLRWTDSDDQPTLTRHIAHALEPGRIFWRTPDATEVAAAIEGDRQRSKVNAPGRQFEGDATADARAVASMFKDGARTLTDARRMIVERLAGKRRGERAFDELTREPGVYGLHVAHATWHRSGFLGTYTNANDAAAALDAAKGESGNRKHVGNRTGGTL